MSATDARDPASPFRIAANPRCGEAVAGRDHGIAVHFALRPEHDLF